MATLKIYFIFSLDNIIAKLLKARERKDNDALLLASEIESLSHEISKCLSRRFDAPGFASSDKYLW